MPSLELHRLAIETRPERSRVVLVVSGELDVASVGDVQSALEELRGSGWEDIVLDLRDVSFIDSTGLTLLMAADDRARREDWRLSVFAGCEPLERLLSVTCLSSPLRRA